MPSTSSDPDTTTTRRPLTPQAIIAGAVALADRIGAQPLTIRKLATELGVKPMAIYHHVANKDVIIDGMVNAVFAEIELPPTGVGWREAMRRRACSAREVLARHPWAPALLDTRANPGPGTLRHHDAVITCLRSAGFSPELVGHAYALLDAFIFGFALQEVSLPFDTGEPPAELAAEILATTTDGAYPGLEWFMSERILRPGYTFADEFDVGLELVLDALQGRFESRPDRDDHPPT